MIPSNVRLLYTCDILNYDVMRAYVDNVEKRLLQGLLLWAKGKEEGKKRGGGDKILGEKTLDITKMNHTGHLHTCMQGVNKRIIEIIRN